MANASEVVLERREQREHSQAQTGGDEAHSGTALDDRSHEATNTHRISIDESSNNDNNSEARPEAELSVNNQHQTNDEASHRGEGQRERREHREVEGNNRGDRGKSVNTTDTTQLKEDKG